jgi:DNA-binding CsgD family transcriptional regulator
MASKTKSLQLLGISIKTVKSHRAATMRKLRLGSFADLVRYAIHNKIIAP